MGDVGDSLHQGFEHFVFHFAEQNRHEDRCGQTDRNAHHRQDDRILKSPPEKMIGKQVLEIFKTYKPIEGEKTHTRLIPAEGNANAEHGRIAKNQKPEQRGRHHHIEPLVPFEACENSSHKEIPLPYVVKTLIQPEFRITWEPEFHSPQIGVYHLKNCISS